MKCVVVCAVVGWLMVGGACAVAAEAKVHTAVNRGGDATAAFKFKDVPAPSATDAANQAKFSLLAGRRDGNGAQIRCLNDGKLPTQPDEPGANFFFAAGSDGGRLLIDLGANVDVKQINAYSWHPTTRGSQVFKLYAAADGGAGFDPKVARRGDPAAPAWQHVADVDTRDANQPTGGQYAVSVADPEGGVLTKSRYLLLIVSPTESDDGFGHTFFSEIDVIDGKDHPPAAAPAPAKPEVLEVADGKYQIEFDCSDVPEIKPWVDEKLKPVCAEWYPKIVELLPSEGYEAPRKFSITFHSDMDGVAYTSGKEVHCAAPWFLANLHGEAAGAVVHEMVHVVQQYGRARGGQRNPGWLVEGLADYIRWFLYEPKNLRPKVDPQRAKYTDSYRTTGAFLDFVVEKHDANAVKKLNAAMREGKFRDALWQEYTGKTADDLWAEYVKTLKN